MQSAGKRLRGKVAGFENQSDFIPLELSDDDKIEPNGPLSRIATFVVNHQPPRREEPTKQTNGDQNKRKRKDVESSPERGPPVQRQKTTEVELNPWQTGLDCYAGQKETARRYTLEDCVDDRLHKEVQDYSNWISPTSKEIEVRAFVAKRVANAIETFYPRCRAYPFGSYSTKLYIPDAYASQSDTDSGISIW
jgi:non-canonical poly(A) RNA polymerase PAPD5/7